MVIVEAPDREKEQRLSWYERWRTVLLGMLLIWAVGMNVVLWLLLPPAILRGMAPFLWGWLVSYLPYGLACWLVLATRPASGRQRWWELGIIIGGAVVLRWMLVLAPPRFSGDIFRYVWDARITLHGYSPYVHAPWDDVLKPLRDNVIFPYFAFHTVPSLYPPGAQAIYLLGYWLVPDNVSILKGIFSCCDIASCILLVWLLWRRGMDPRRCVIYAWCPLPIIELTMVGHIDAAVIPLLLLIVSMSYSQEHAAVAASPGRSRVHAPDLTSSPSRTNSTSVPDGQPSVARENFTRKRSIWLGFLLGLATLVKIYPVILLPVFWRRKEYALLIVFVVTVVIGYIPYVILGQRHILGFFSTYTNEHGANGGVVQILLGIVGKWLHWSTEMAALIERIVDVVLLAIAGGIVFWGRQRERISREASILLLIGTLFAISSHVFPWYTTVFLPWIALLSGSLWVRVEGRRVWRPSMLALLALWYFSCISITGYFFSDTRDWHQYYLFAYAVTMTGLIAAVAIYGWQRRSSLKKIISRSEL